MKYEFTLPGFEEQSLALEVRFPLRPRLWVNRRVIKSKGKWNEIALKRDDGLSSIIHINNQFPDPVPQLEMDEEVYHVVPPLNWGQRIWAMLPIALVALEIWGLLIGLLAAYLNIWVMRLQERKLERNLTIFTVSIAAAAAFFIIRFLIIRSQIGL
ncbi:MAG: hypothetical protein JEZ00_13670 [Anaerolineaceae bacterium]|nr:hypothetical protein [Anaerolineaceae bacterium]